MHVASPSGLRAALYKMHHVRDDRTLVQVHTVPGNNFFQYGSKAVLKTLLNKIKQKQSTGKGNCSLKKLEKNKDTKALLTVYSAQIK